MRFDAGAQALYEKHDAEVLDPLKFSDHRLAGRLNEQAFKLAALLALFDKRTVISAGDLSTEIGRASCRARVCQDVEISVVAVALKKKTITTERRSSQT